MRIVVTNPDAMGDAVLRLPMLQAIAREGHPLLVICRPLAEYLLRRGLAGTDARIAVVPESPYEMARAGRSDFNREVLTRIHEFQPDTLVFGPYQWTILEDWLSRELPGLARIRMNGYRFEGRSVGPLPAGDETIVPVDEHWHETAKSERLCAQILGHDVKLGDPSLQADDHDKSRAREQIASAQGGTEWLKRTQERGFWIGCMGNTDDYYSDVREWGREHWTDTIRHLVRVVKVGVLLTGSDAERPSLERLRLRSGVDEDVCVITGQIGTEDGTSQLLGLTTLARAYIGRDTGPMHLAAALGKPVIAVFGGGTWPRFTPMATPSLAITVAMPCAPCGWFCHLPEPLCIRMVPPARILQAITAIADGSARRRLVEALNPEGGLREGSVWEAL